MRKIKLCLACTLAMLLLFSAAACKEGQPDSKEPVLEGKTITILGDSFTEIGTYIPPLLEKTGFGSVNNYGKAGSCICGDEIDSFVNRYNSILEDCDYFLIQGGTNDYSTSKPMGERDSADIATFYGALNTILSRIQGDYPSAVIAITTPSQRNWNGDSPTETQDSVGINKQGLTLADYCDAIRYVAEKNDILVVDLYNDCGITKENAELYTTDGLHPNTAGSEMIAECIYQAFRNRAGK